MTEAKEYSFINTRIKARKGELFSSADYERLLSSSLIEGLSYLQDTPRYKDSLTSVDLKANNFIETLVDSLYKNVYDEMLVLLKDTPKKARALIEFYLKKPYTNILKQIIRKIHTKDIESLVSRKFIIANSDEKTELAIISKVESIEELIQKLQTPWVVEALNSKLDEYQKQKNILLLENAIDHSFYKQIWEVIIPSQNERDRKVTEKIIGTEIDLINLNIVLRSKLLNFPSKNILFQIIPINYRLRSVLDQAVEAFSFQDAIDQFQTTVYSDLIQAIFREYREKDKSITKIEQLQKEWFIQSLLTMMAGYPFHIGIFLAYIIFRLQETENLRIIFETKWKGIDIEFARELLIYFK
ncbi:MAG: V-type ATPase subunit [Candidatus Hermodarchaeota archaeon]